MEQGIRFAVVIHSRHLFHRLNHWKINTNFGVLSCRQVVIDGRFRKDEIKYVFNKKYSLHIREIAYATFYKHVATSLRASG